MPSNTVAKAVQSMSPQSLMVILLIYQSKIMVSACQKALLVIYSKNFIVHTDHAKQLPEQVLDCISVKQSLNPMVAQLAFVVKMAKVLPLSYLCRFMRQLRIN